MKTSLIVFAFLCSVLAQTCVPGLDPVANARLASGYTAYNWACNLKGPRTILPVSTGEILVLESSSGQITCLFDDDQNGYSDDQERVVLVTQNGLNHALAINGNYLYASTSSTVYRWAIPAAGIRTPVGLPQVVVTNMPTGGHSSRTIVFDGTNGMYVSCGSDQNVDPNPNRALIRSFDVTTVPNGGFSWNTATIFAIGLRNEVGLRFDSKGSLWGVENGVDNLQRKGVDIHINNPGEEINNFGNPSTVADGKFYGYPYCFSTFNLDGYTAGTQLAHPDFPQYNDSWCQNNNNVVKPAYVLPAHVAPLDLIFYPDDATEFVGVNSGDVFVTAHGSWNRSPPQGYTLYKVSNSDGTLSEHTQFFSYDSDAANDDPSWLHRPVGLAWSPCTKGRCLLMSSDKTGQIFSIYYSAGVVSSSISICLILALTFLVSLF
eukprot:TRINITY_DN1587_c0_g2_i1.p1 TRINITY_DN1587_c0_g2~~TRINITY_DN1587_c0_g2_i1.p1  ORF type:complete len:433 (+),score=75.18 TRINITY_DN1587_c0_g2_i1:40-1338(+)